MVGFDLDMTLIDTVPGFAATLGVPVLNPGQGVGAAELQAALDRCGTDLRPGDVAVVRTGWARHFDDAERYLVGHIEEKVEGLDVVSPTAPLGAALLGAKAGDTVGFEAPNGELRVRVLRVEAS